MGGREPVTPLSQEGKERSATETPTLGRLDLPRYADCRAPLLEECPQHHGHKGDPGVTLGACGFIDERAQVILVWMRVLGRRERLPPTETRSHKGWPRALNGSWHCDS